MREEFSKFDSPSITLGITGHQKLPQQEQWAWVEYQFSRILSELSSFDKVVVSSLAAGTDQLFADTALCHNAHLQVIIPSEGYRQTFTGSTDLEHYDYLLKRAESIITLDFANPSEEAYMCAGRQVVDRCQLLVAVWNGLPAVGLGGTADVVQYALNQGRHVTHLNPLDLSVREL